MEGWCVVLVGGLVRDKKDGGVAPVFLDDFLVPGTDIVCWVLLAKREKVGVELLIVEGVGEDLGYGCHVGACCVADRHDGDLWRCVLGRKVDVEVVDDFQSLHMSNSILLVRTWGERVPRIKQASMSNMHDYCIKDGTR